MNRSLFSGLSSRGWHPADLMKDFARAGQLLRHPRVPLSMKLLFPLGALAYWVIPTDLLPILPVDDIVVVLIALRTFVWLGEKAVGGATGAGENENAANPNQVVDTTWRVVDE